ncbi:MAG: stage VI sporulation protein F [Lactobacillus sp.]|jgi:hypothetical protein|nr:stage VI sporulation protein F [Lactobacillus sp.]MCI2032009.1 stage VI sporulation protein F [Lactobacillus sp.]
MRDHFQTLRFAGIVAAAKSRRIRLPSGQYQLVDTITLGAYYYFDNHGRPLDWPAWTLLVQHNGDFLKYPGTVSIGDILKLSGKLQAINLEVRQKDEQVVRHLEKRLVQMLNNVFLGWLKHVSQATPILKSTDKKLRALLADYVENEIPIATLLNRGRLAIQKNEPRLINNYRDLLDDLRPILAATQAQIDQLMPPAFLVTNARHVKVYSNYHPDWHPEPNDTKRFLDEAYRHTQFRQIVANQAYRTFHKVPLALDSYYRGKRFWDPQMLNQFTKGDSSRL